MTDDRLDKVRGYRDELWRSMVRDIRLQLAQEEANGVLSEPYFSEPLRNEMTLTCKGGYISVWLEPQTGKGSWNQLSPIDECEPYFVSPTGDFKIKGETMDVSDAAKWFVNRLIAK